MLYKPCSVIDCGHKLYRILCIMVTFGNDSYIVFLKTPWYFPLAIGQFFPIISTERSQKSSVAVTSGTGSVLFLEGSQSPCTVTLPPVISSSDMFWWKSECYTNQRVWLCMCFFFTSLQVSFNNVTMSNDQGVWLETKWSIHNFHWYTNRPWIIIII